MNSRPVARVPLAALVALAELPAIGEFEFNNEYTDFTFGIWRNCVLWNGSGDYRDSVLNDYEGKGRPTALLRALPQVNELIRRTVNVEHLRWVRIFVLRRGWLLPHRDFLETSRGFTRLHLPLNTDASCLHSEESEVYRMRVGELWWLDAERVHSACCLSDTTRVSVCLDLRAEVPFEALLAANSRPRHEIAPLSSGVRRPPLDRHTCQRICATISAADECNFRDVVGQLAQVHFRYRVDAAAMFDWLIEGSAAHPVLRDRARSLRRFAIQSRDVGESNPLSLP